MLPDAYSAFTQELTDRLMRDGRVLGLVALGSMARRDSAPDRWSDHDFFVVVEAGHQEAFRSDLRWLPRPEAIVFSFRETAHGVKVLYDDGHLLEFAVFDLDELGLARVNRFRVLFDRKDVQRRLEQIAELTDRDLRSSSSPDTWLLGQFLTNLLVGAGRERRGERLSGRQFVMTHALRHLLLLLERHLPSARREVLDNLDPLRRFEQAFPDLGAELNGILDRGMPAAAAGLLRLAQRELAPRLEGFPTRAAEVVLAQIEAP
jgi:hypothetical protein